MKCRIARWAAGRMRALRNHPTCQGPLRFAFIHNLMLLAYLRREETRSASGSASRNHGCATREPGQAIEKIKS
jgi:hypothetical protein